MRIEDLKVNRFLSGLDVDALFARFQEEEGGRGTDEFLAWLHRHQAIDKNAFVALHTQERIDVSLPVEEGGEAEALALMVADHGYDDLGRVGQGGMGSIHLVRERDLGRTVALKRLRPEVARDPKVAALFFQEVQITAQLAHPSIVPIYRVLEDDEGTAAYSMKLIQGRTLMDLMNEARRLHLAGTRVEGALDLQSFLEHFLKVCDAVAYAHERGIVHRDLKPANIMIGPFNEVYVMDWGVARGTPEPDTEMDIIPLDAEGRPSEVAGTPAYMSPEQARGELGSLQPASDQYTLGLILFELVTLRRANQADDPMDALVNAIAGERAPFVHANPNVPIPRELKAIVERATNPEPVQRYPSVMEFAEDIRRFLANQEVMARPDGPLEKAGRWLSRNREKALMIISALLVLVFGTIIGFMIHDQRVRAASRAREVALGEILTRIARQSHLVDEHFLRYEGLVQGLAGAAAQALQRGMPEPAASDGPAWYLDQDYSDPDRAPADLATTGHYRRPISTEWTVFKLAPGVETDSVLPLLDRLAPLRHEFRSLMIRSHDEEAVTWDHARQEILLREEGVPLVWTYVGFEEGIHEAFPGKSGYAATYDPRERPWYRSAVRTHGPRWGLPYVDAIGMGLILPCTMAIYDSRGSFRGVAGVELTLGHIIENLLEPPDMSGVNESFLLDQQGRIVIRSSQKGSVDIRESEAKTLLDFETFPVAPVVRAVQEMASGYYEEGGQLVVYYRMNAVGWYFVVEGPSDALLLGIR